MNLFTVRIISLLIVVLFSCGCATNPNKIGATYVSPYKYKDYTENQIIMEMDHISRRTTELYNSLKKEASSDKAQMAIGMVLFWPALFFLEGGDGPEAAEYARLKGEYEALRQVAIQKNMNIYQLPMSPEQTIKSFGDD